MTVAVTVITMILDGFKKLGGWFIGRMIAIHMSVKDATVTDTVRNL